MTDEQRKKIEEAAEFQTLSFVGKRIFLQAAQFALSNLIQEESKWIKTSERLPTIHDAGAFGTVIVWDGMNPNSSVIGFGVVIKYPAKYPLWQPLPSPPKINS